MHGLVNRSIQYFIRDTYGAAAWDAVVARSKMAPPDFDVLQVYDDTITEALVTSGCVVLNKMRATFLEDIGIYLVTNPGVDQVRRLLRYSGTSYAAFLHALEDLPERARLAMPDLDLPELRLEQTGGQTYRLAVLWRFPGAAHVMAGILRAMADDYGALVMLDVLHDGAGDETIEISLHELEFTAGRSFALAGGAA